MDGSSSEPLDSMLSGGHPNSLGRTGEAVLAVLADRSRLDELLGCYRSEDAVVRLRASSVLKRVGSERPAWLVPLIDRLIDDVGRLDQASARWTLAELFLRLAPTMSAAQRSRATALLQGNLLQQTDWIVLIRTMETLHRWSMEDAGLRAWLLPHLERLTRDRRPSVAKKASGLSGGHPDDAPAGGTAEGPAVRPSP